MKQTILFFFISIFILSCTKNKPPTGNYTGAFNGTYEKGGQIVELNVNYLFILTESDKDHITLELENAPSMISVLAKDGKHISGVIDASGSAGSDPLYIWEGITIDGNWDKSNGKYSIKGVFSRNYEIVHAAADSLETYPITGTFEIKEE